MPKIDDVIDMVRIVVVLIGLAAGAAGCLNGNLESSSFASESFRQAYFFNGATSNVTVTGLTQTLPTAYTIEFFFKTNAGGFQYIVNFAAVAANVYLSGGQLTFSAPNGGCGGSITAAFNGGYNDGILHHAAAVQNGANIYLYVDGSLVASNAVGAVSCGYATLYIGALNGSSNWFNGTIEEMRISNTARYTANFSRPTSPFSSDASTLNLFHFDSDMSRDYISNGGTFTPTNITINSSPLF